MADVLSKSNLFSPCPHLCISVSPKKTSSLAGFPSLRFKPLRSSLNSDFHGRQMIIQKGGKEPRTGRNSRPFSAQMSLTIGKAQKWWEKGIQPNMKEINSAEDLVGSLLKAGDKLVIVDFFSPGCGGCRALHPKICQFAEMSPDVQFIQVNYEEHKSMCYSLNVHVLPFFRFYRGAHGRLCSFSCTNATIKKFKDALAKHATDRCSLGPPKGLEEKELLALAANKDLSFNYSPKRVEPVPNPAQEEVIPAKEAVPASFNLSGSSSSKAAQESDRALVGAGR